MPEFHRVPRSDRYFPHGFALERNRSDLRAEMRFFRDFDYAVDWCVEQFGPSGNRWRVDFHEICFARRDDADRFIENWGVGVTIR